MVARNVPGDTGVPWERNAAEPSLCRKGRLASVSTLLTSVGRSATPASNGRGGLSVGLAGPPLIARTAAVSSPATYPGSHRQQVDRDAVQLGAELCERRFDAAGRFGVGHVDVGAVGGHDHSGQPQPVQNQVRAVAQQPAVLDRSRFSLFAVGDGDGAARARGRYREPRATSPRAGRPRRRGRPARWTRPRSSSSSAPASGR